MEREPKIVGKNLTPKTKEIFSKTYKNIEERSVLPYRQELRKNEKAKEILQKINSWIGEEFERLGLKYTAIPAEKVHLFYGESFNQAFPKESETVSGLSLPVKREAGVRTSDDMLRTITTIIHEMLHLASHNVYYIHDVEKKYSNYRTGYQVTNRDDIEKPHQHFVGLNEGVIDLMTSEMAHKKFDDIVRLLNVPSDKEILKDVKWYWVEAKVTSSVIEKISEAKGEKWGAVYQRFKKGLFTGEMMHLRDAEKVFGEGSLRILGELSPTDKNAPEAEKDKYIKIYKFFTSEDPAEREELRKELLPLAEEKKAA